jgi:DNA-binding PadR family transcriptional regulator
VNPGSPEQDPEQAARFLPLSPQTFQVLLSLHDEARHGYSVIQDVRARTGGEMRLTASTLYDALARMVDQALIEPAAAPAGETDSRRRYYRLTPLGRAVAAAEARRLARLVDMARAKSIPVRD